MMPGNMSCRELVELVTDYLDGALAQEDVQRLHEHIEVCGPCAEYIEQVRTTARMAAEAAAAELDMRPDRDALLAAFRGFKRATAES
jgi:predicted anti-sigma-YlaC factor YlaD